MKATNEKMRIESISPFKKGDLILIKKPGIICKLSIPYEGPFKVVKHGRNGSITYEKSLNVYDTVNILRVNLSTKNLLTENNPQTMLNKYNNIKVSRTNVK